MAVQKIIIADSEYTVRFDFSSFREMGRLWKLDSLTEVMKKLGSLDSVSEDGLTFSQEDILATMIIAGIKTGDDSVAIPKESDIVAEVYENPKLIEQVTKWLITALPKVSGNANPAKRAGKKRTKPGTT